MVFKRKELTYTQTIAEEIANAITHGFGIILSIIALFALIYGSINRGSILHIVSCSIYGVSLLILYVISTLYHSIRNEKQKKIFRKLDHISIYLLITGTYMPLTLVVLKGAFGWTLFGLIWSFCIIGILFKVFFGPKYELISSLFYLLMGWLAVFAIKPLIAAVTLNAFILILIGGLFYSLGVIFFAMDKKFSYFHAIWHMFVLAGSICHFFMIFLYVIPFSA
jgi:hemolysin III